MSSSTSSSRSSSTKDHVRVVAAEIEQDGRYLITQRNTHAVLPLLWEFPGGKVEPGETDEEALTRELLEVLGVRVSVGQRAMHVSHEYDHYTLDLMVYRVSITSGEPRCLAVHDVKWVTPQEFSDHEFPGADQQTVDTLLGR
jgi:8-oxo-dGTP diphosphatase